MLSRFIKYARKIFFVSPVIPTHVDIEISTACNLHCKMCKRETIDFGNSFMPFDVLTRIVDKLPEGVEVISFGGYGEMMLHPRFFDMVAYAHSKGFKTETTTNGTLLTPDNISKLLDSNLDMLRISIDHIKEPEIEKDVGHVFSQNIIQNAEYLVSQRAKRSHSIKIGINTVVHSGNINEIEDIIRLADKLGLDKVELIRFDTCANKLERTLQVEKERELYNKIEKMDKRIAVITPANRFARWRRAYNLTRDFCIFRFQSAHIRIGGQVTPCAFGFATHDYGNIHSHDLAQIWQSEEFRKIRKSHNNPVCASCGIFKWQ